MGFTGGSSPEEGPMGDVHVLNLEEGCEKWERPRVAGQAPEPREMHAGVFFRLAPSAPSDNLGDTLEVTEELLVAGGRGRDGVVFRDAHVLDVRAMKWTRRGDFGEPVCAHAAAPWPAPEEAHARRRWAAAFFGGFDGAALRGSDVTLLERETLAKAVLSGASRGFSSDGDGSAASVKIPAARFAPACIAVDVWVPCLVRLFVVFGGVTPAFDLGDVAVWMDGPDYERAAVAAKAEPERPGVVPPASDLD